MANEDIQAKMDFIIEQQAQFSADIGELKDTVKELAGDLKQLTGTVASMANVLNDTQDLVKRLVVVTHTGFEKTQASINELAQAQARTDQRLAETDSRLNILIDVVERYFSNGKH